MFGQRILFENVSNLAVDNELNNSRDIDSTEADGNQQVYPFLRRLCMQAKQISQIIAYIWRWAEEDVNEFSEQVDAAKRLKRYFDNPNEPGKDKKPERLKKLLSTDPRKFLDGKSDLEEGELLVKVFGEDRIRTDNFPIFTQEEASIYLFTVNVNAFQGSLADPDVNGRRLIKFQIPYPPSPKLGEATVTKQELEEWISNTENDVFFADSPYIPTTCS
ncbi:hypothetical protein G7B40_011055 [Aetokthonos hydrillicola Thurmond2011]|jgi:hypothetical protein|uniref:Uncharacterized protein n=1 Tax=Aetokthonos hydrillicola Thurmond2011 TaxID=2712845 RepID=A0AAP5M4R9_9CYAN|nr:hypothetical protein [Aetokthonos hydrillicola]MBO3459798.1 hypothetical protein [Aetokthonos hydrillicola CCALA 1050]MBW4584557.1 hypothetical protein [Aetokthonos hydrillicola CCALA 1050]MDR9895101.1 hypothetical protein [Aetokthonos hydrillicola Thurmond2011]